MNGTIPLAELTSILNEPARRFFTEAEEVLGSSDIALSRFQWGHQKDFNFSTVIQTVNQLVEHQEGVLDLLRRTQDLPDDVWVPVDMTQLYQNTPAVISIAQHKEKRDAVVHFLHTLADQQLGDPLVKDWKWLAQPSLETLEGMATLAAQEELTLTALNTFRNGIGRPLHVYHTKPVGAFFSWPNKEGIFYHAKGFLQIAPEASAIVQALDARYKGEQEGHSFSRFEELAHDPQNTLALAKYRSQIDAFRKIQSPDYQGWSYGELRDAVPLAELATNLTVVRLMQRLQPYRGEYIKQSGIGLENLYGNGIGAPLNNQRMVELAAHADEVINFAKVAKEYLGEYMPLHTLLREGDAGLRLVADTDILESFAVSLRAAGYTFPNHDNTLGNIYQNREHNFDSVRNAVRHCAPFVGIVSAMHKEGYTLSSHSLEGLMLGANAVYTAMQQNPFTVDEITPAIVGQLTAFNRKQYSIMHLTDAVEEITHRARKAM